MSVQYPRLLTFNDPTDPTGKTIVLVHSKEEEAKARERAKMITTAPPPPTSNVSNGGVNVDRYGEQVARARQAGNAILDVTDAATAAEVIRPEVDRTVGQKVSPGDRRRLWFVREVMAILDLEDNPANVKHVEELLKKHDIDPALTYEWPKHYYHKDGRDVQVESPEALAALQKDDPGWADKPPAKEKEKETAKAA